MILLSARKLNSRFTVMCAKCGLKNNWECTCNTRLNDTRWKRRNTRILCFVVSFLMARYKTAIRRAAITSLASMRSVCAVSRSVIRCVLRVLRSPEHTITTNALYVSDSASNVLSTNPKEKLGLEQRSGATDFRSKVTVCRHIISNRHAFPVLTIAVYSSYTVGSHKHQACSSRMMTINEVSLSSYFSGRNSSLSPWDSPLRFSLSLR